jgi:hypothetical protein
VNARYSTVGLLSMIGVNFGDEQISYSDLSWQLNFPHKKGRISVFGFAGKSQNLFKGKQDTVKIENEKELYDISYSSFTMANGITSSLRLKQNLILKNVLVYSMKEAKRSADALNRTWIRMIPEENSYIQQKISTQHYVVSNIRGRIVLKAGSHVNLFINEAKLYIADRVTNAERSDLLIQPFASVEGYVSSKLELKFGLNGFFQERIGYFSLQPSGSIKYNVSKSGSFELAYATAKQLQPFLIYAAEANENLHPTSSQSFSLAHFASVKKFSFNTEMYYSMFDKIPVNTAYAFSTFNYLNEFILMPLEQTGKAKVYGLDETVRFDKGKFYALISGGIYQSLYEINSVYRNARFSTTYNAVITAGKEFTLSTKRTFGVDIRSTMRNGFKESLIQPEYTNLSYTSQLPVYFRTDLRLSYKNERKKSTVIWAIDIQNLSNKKNIAYHYFDDFTGKVETRYQLGLIPVLSYKLLF